jgi:hypothetical protein
MPNGVLLGIDVESCDPEDTRSLLSVQPPLTLSIEVK